MFNDVGLILELMNLLVAEHFLYEVILFAVVPKMGLGWKDKLIIFLVLSLVVLWLLLWYVEPESTDRKKRMVDLAQEVRDAYETIKKPSKILVQEADGSGYKYLDKADIEPLDFGLLKERYRQRVGEAKPAGKGFANEELCRSVLEGIFGVPFPKARPDFLANPLTGYRTNLELDGYNEGLGIAFEYNGKGHYVSSAYPNKNEEQFRQTVLRDRIKRELCEQANVNLIVVPYTIGPQDIREFILSKLPD